MIYELAQSDFDHIRPLYSEHAHHPIVNGIVDGWNRGRIFVDNQASPRSALVWAEHEIFFLIGDPFNRSFVKALPKLIKEQIMPASLAMGEICFQVEMISAKWFAQIESYLDEFIPKYYDRISFTFKPHLNQQLPDWRKRVPKGYRVQKIDAELLADPDAEVVHNVVHRYWRSEELFLKHGIGYVVRKGKKVISCCLSTFASETDIEVGIQTFQPKDRKRGLATLAARALLDECIRQQRTPHWKTESFRLASIRLAQKVGFADKTVYRAYYFFYDPLDNLVFSAYHRLKEMGDMAEAAMYIDQAKSYGELHPFHQFILACGYAAAEELDIGLEYLRRAVERGWRYDLSDERFERDLQNLRRIDEGHDLIMQLSGH